MIPKSKFLFASAIATTAIFACQTAHALTKADNATALGTAASWVENTAPTSADVLTWNSTVTTANTVAMSSLTIASIQIVNPGGNVTINNTGTSTFSSGFMDLSTSTVDATINGGFVRVANTNYSAAINVAAGRTLTLGSAISNQGNTKTFSFNGPGNVILNGGGGSGGAMSFAVTGGGIVTFNAAGSWAGSANALVSGTINIGIDTAFGGNNVNFGGGTAVGTAVAPTLIASGGARTVANNITLLAPATGTATIAGSNALTLNGTVTNSGGNRTLTVTNTALTTLGGTVNLSENATNRTLTIAGSGNTTISGIVSNGTSSTASGLTYGGTGTLTLTNANTYKGATTVTSGNYTLSSTGSLNGTNSTVASGATFDLSDNALYTFAIGANGIVNGAAAAGISGAGIVNLNGDFAFNLALATLADGNTWTIENVSSLTGPYGATFSVVGFTDSGNDTWTLVNGTNTWTFLENTGVLSLAVAVPEPSAAALLGLGLGAAVLRRKRRTV